MRNSDNVPFAGTGGILELWCWGQPWCFLSPLLLPSEKL